jgi:hypothetical protein
MELRSTGKLAAAGVFVLAACLATPALAQDMGSLAGDVQGGYTHYDTRQAAKDGDTNEWTAGGSAVFTLSNPGVNFQGNFENAGLKVKNQSTDDWGYGGDIFWRDFAGDVGLNVTADSVSKGTSGDYQSEDIFGQFYVLPNLTLGAKGGHIGGDFSGWFGDSRLVFYPFDDVALTLAGDYARIQHAGPQMEDAAFTAEYLPVRDVPVTLAFGYTYARYTHLAPPPAGGLDENLNVFSVALKFYFGGGGRRASLVDYQRGGTESWDGPPPTLVGIGF